MVVERCRQTERERERGEEEEAIEVLRSLGSHTERVVGGLIQAHSRGIERDRKKRRKVGVDVVKEEVAEGGHVEGDLRGERSLRRRYYYSQLEDYQYP